MSDKRTPVQEAEELADKLCSMVNVMGNKEGTDAFINYIVNKTHRTLQQSTMRLMCRVICKLADQEYTDLRNIATKDLARKLKPIIDESGLPFI